MHSTRRPRVLLTGSSGRVGRAIAARLRADYDVVGLDLVPGPFTTLVGGIGDAGLVADAVRGSEAIVHTAALHAPHVGRESAARFHAVNVTGTRILLDAALHAGIRRVVYTSSTSVYGHALEPAGRAVWVTEQLEPGPRDVYDETKLAAEQLCREAAATGALDCIALRIGRCFPEPTRLVAQYRLYRGVDLRDVAEAHHLALRSALTGYQVFVVSAQSPFEPPDCTELLHDARAVLRRRVPDAEDRFAALGWTLPGSIDRVYAIDTARQALGYCPRFNFAELIATLAESRRNGPDAP
jgi:nucleoside-diphosphate-sugar epimerase